MPPSVRDIGGVALRAAVGRRRGPVGRLRWWVRPAYVDFNLHMNYASYLEVMELARWDWGVRSGLFTRWWAGGLRPVVGSIEIVYLRELRPLQRFVVETRAVGFDRRALVVDHRLVSGGVVHATARLNILLLHAGRPASREVVEDACADVIVPAVEAASA